MTLWQIIACKMLLLVPLNNNTWGGYAQMITILHGCSVYVTLCACSKSELGGGNVRKPQKYTSSQQLSIQWLVAVASYPLKMHPLIDWCNGWYLVQGRSQVCWWLNAEARKYMNTVVGDAPKIWRWKCFKRKFSNAINATIRRWCNMRDRIVKLDLSTQWDLCLPSI